MDALKIYMWIFEYFSRCTYDKQKNTSEMNTFTRFKFQFEPKAPL